MRVRRNSEADYNLKVRTTLIIHEGGKKSKKKGLNKQSFYTTAYLSLPSLLLTVTKTPRLALGESSNKESVFWSIVSKFSLVPQKL